VGVVALALSACSALHPAKTAPPAFYTFGNQQYPAQGPPTAQLPAKALTLAINPVRAASGFDSQRIIYVRQTHKLEYFAHSEWIDTPGRMLGPLLVASIEKTGAFRAVVLTPGSANGDLRLDTEIIRLQQDFQTSPSRVHFTLRAYLVEEKTRRVLAWREFDANAVASSEDPQGGVTAASLAVQTVLDELSLFCADAARDTGTKK
jgi:cholesterol transport system auxiliary component